MLSVVIFAPELHLVLPSPSFSSVLPIRFCQKGWDFSFAWQSHPFRLVARVWESANLPQTELRFLFFEAWVRTHIANSSRSGYFHRS